MVTDHHCGVEVNPITLSSPTSSPEPVSLNDASLLNTTAEDEQTSENIAAPLITITKVSPESSKSPTLTLRSRPQKKLRSKRRTAFDQSRNSSESEATTINLGYNAYGELIDTEKLTQPPNPNDLSVTETMRLISRTHHHELRSKTGGAIAIAEEVRVFYDHQVVLWGFNALPTEETPPEGPRTVSVYKGPLRALELGCGDGFWCFLLKKQHPEWIVEGLDDVDNWSRQYPDTKFRDFMESDDASDGKEYFGRVHLTQDHVEFTVRDLNSLLTHPKPLPHHVYSVIRARDIFGKIESYKTFLEDIRCILQPEGVFELIELDPRPRISISRRRRSVHESHISRAATDWTDKIADRFKDLSEEQLTSLVPAWTRRVEERVKATLRPRDGIAAIQLKAWLQGAGFYDVKQLIIRLPVGGSSASGKRLMEVMAYQAALEDSFPVLAKTLPAMDLEGLNFGNYYINMHVVTGRKARFSRPGDLLLDGSRQGMTSLTYNVMDRLRSAGAGQWSRTVLDGNLAASVRELRALRGGRGSGDLEMMGMPRSVRLERQARDRSSA